MQYWVLFTRIPLRGALFAIHDQAQAKLCRRVIIDLSWPQGASVNSGINKNTYLESQFDLTFPSVDDITNEVKRLGRGPSCIRWMLAEHSDM